MKRIIRLCVLSCLLVSCQNNLIQDQDITKEAVRLDVNINDEPARGESMVIGKQSFVLNDATGLYVQEIETQSKWVFDGTAWNVDKDVFWSAPECTFSVYYPYNSNSTYNGVLMPDLSLQKGTDADMEKFDFVASKAKFIYQDCGGIVSFSGEKNLKHIYAVVVVNLDKKQKDEKIEVNRVKFLGADLFSKSIYSFADETIQISQSERKNELIIDYPANTILADDKSFSIKIFVNPLECPENLKFNIEYTENGIRKIAKAENLSKQFKSGSYYMYNMLLNNRNKLEITGTNINGTIEEQLPEVILPE